MVLNLYSRNPLPFPNQKNKHARLQVEQLEDRTAPATFQAGEPYDPKVPEQSQLGDLSIALDASALLNNATAITRSTTITRPGRYQLTNDIFVTAGNGINIQADDVTIDLNGFSIIGPRSAAGSGFGIWAFKQNRIAIRNGTIRGFQYGVYLSSAASELRDDRLSFEHGGHRIESLQIVANTFRGIRVEGRGNVVRDNIIRDTGGTTVYNAPIVAAIETYGPGAVIEGNYIHAVRGQGYGISVADFAGGTVIRDNVLSNGVATASEFYHSAAQAARVKTWGIRARGSSSDITVAKNSIVNYFVGIGINSTVDALLTGNSVSQAEVSYYVPSRTVDPGLDNQCDGITCFFTESADYLDAPDISAKYALTQEGDQAGGIRQLRGPSVITKSGHYQLQNDIIVSSGIGLEIQTGDVTIDLNGYSIISTGGAGAQTYGIWAKNQRRVRIHNGTIRGFLYGVYISDSYDEIRQGKRKFDDGGHIVEKLRLMANTFRGIRMEGRGNVIRDNIIEDTGGTTLYDDPFAMGIESYGPGALISNNRVYAIRGHGFGISLTNMASGALVKNNFITHSSRTVSARYRPGTDGTANDSFTAGVYVNGAESSALVEGNQILNFGYGVHFTTSAHGLITGNIVSDAFISFYTPLPVSEVAGDNYFNAERGHEIEPGDHLQAQSATGIAAPTQVYGISSSIRPITAPMDIRQPGHYRLLNDIYVSSGNGIEIFTSDVTIDLNGFSIIGPGSDNTGAIGIWAFDQQDITIRNGTVRGFLYGVYLSDAADRVQSDNWSFDGGGHLVENMRFWGNTFRGIRVEGRGNVVRDNIIQDTGGTRVYSRAIVAAIESFGPGAIIEDNQIFAIRGRGHGISLTSHGSGTIVHGNVLSNSSRGPEAHYSSATDGTAANLETWAITVKGAETSVLVTGNNVVNFFYGITFAAGAGGLAAGNAITVTSLPFYLPDQNPRVEVAGNNSSDKQDLIHEGGEVTLPRNPAVGTIAQSSIDLSAGVIGITGATTISKPGHYRLERDIFVSEDDGIVIKASDVTIDLNGHQIVGPRHAANTSFGIYAIGRDRITIRNGTIRGFFYAVYLSDNYDIVNHSNTSFDQGGHLVENLFLDNNTFRGVRIEGRGNVVRDNIIQNTGGTTVHEEPYSFGVESYGPGAWLNDNAVFSTHGGGTIGEGVGVSISRIGGGSVVQNNLVANSARRRAAPFARWAGTSDSTWGIWIGGYSTNALVTGNLITNFKFSVTFHRTSDGLLSDNISSFATVPYYTPAVRADANEIGVPEFDEPIPLAFFGLGNMCDMEDCLEVIEASY